MVVPALDHVELRAAVEGCLEPISVAADRDPGVVGREHESDDLRRSTSEGLVDGVRDPRLPVLHPNEDGNPELLLEPGALRLGDLVQGGDAEPAVARDELVDGLLAGGPPATDVLEVGRDVLEPGGASVGHQHDSGVPRHSPVTHSGHSARHT